MISGDSDPSRRGVTVGATSGLAAALTGTATSRIYAAQTEAAPATGEPSLVDPRTDYLWRHLPSSAA